MILDWGSFEPVEVLMIWDWEVLNLNTRNLSPPCFFQILSTLLESTKDASPPQR